MSSNVQALNQQDGRYRALDNIFVKRLWRNVKYEDVYLNSYATIGELHAGITRYFAFCNGERPHLGLNYQTPDAVYESGEGGGVMIVNKYGSVPVLGLVAAMPRSDASSAGEHGTPPQTVPCRELNEVTAALIDK